MQAIRKKLIQNAIALGVAASACAIAQTSVPSLPPGGSQGGFQNAPPTDLPRPGGRLPATIAGRRLGERFECMVEPFMIASVGSPVDGVLEEVLVDRGDHVRKNQVVARLRSGVEAASVDLYKARVEFGRRKVERNEELHRKQLISTQEKDEMETDLRVNEQELKKESENLRLRTINSPFDGVVVERQHAPGELIRSDKSVVLKLAQIDPLNVEIVASANLFGSIKIGMTGEVSMDPIVRGIHLARVTVVDKVIDAASGTFGVRLALPNPDDRIPAGVRCSVRFRTAGTKN